MNSHERNPIKQPIRKNIYRIISPVLLLVVIAVAGLTFATAYNANTGYVYDSPLKILLYVIIAIGIALSVCAAFFFEKDDEICFNEKIDLIGHLILSIILVLCTVIALINSDGIIFLAGAGAEKILKSVLLCSTIIIFLLDRALWQKNKNRDAFALISGYATIIFCISAIAILYFDVSVEMNNPQKLFIQFSLASVCLSTLARMKLSVNGKGLRLFVISSTCSVLLCPIAAISASASFFANSKPISHFYFFIALSLAARAIYDMLTAYFSSVRKKQSLSEEEKVKPPEEEQEIPEDPQEDQTA